MSVRVRIRTTRRGELRGRWRSGGQSGVFGTATGTPLAALTCRDRLLLRLFGPRGTLRG